MAWTMLFFLFFKSAYCSFILVWNQNPEKKLLWMATPPYRSYNRFPSYLLPPIWSAGSPCLKRNWTGRSSCIRRVWSGRSAGQRSRTKYMWIGRRCRWNWSFIWVRNKRLLIKPLWKDLEHNISVQWSSHDEIVPAKRNSLDRGEGEGERAFLHVKPKGSIL